MEVEPGGGRRFTFKILALGDQGTGKTSLIRRFVKNQFSYQYKSTVGVDFATRTVELESGDVVELQLWDVAGQERFGSLMPVYCRGAQGVLYVFDCARPKTLTSVPKWKQSLEHKTNLPDLPSVLLANKSDLRHAFPEATADMTVDLGRVSCGWHYTSAKDNTGIESSILELVYHLVALYPDAAEALEETTVQLDVGPPPGSERGCCAK